MARDFGHGTTALEVVEGIDLSGKTVIVTGASSGLGVETARALAKAGAKVVLPGRSPDKLAGVVEDIKASTGNQKVEAAEMDLGDLDSVRRFADAFVATGEPLHLLINNAGIMATPHRTTAQGFESQFGTNHLGHFVLFAHLLPALEKAGTNGGARVVALSSTGHRISDVDLEDPNFETSDYHKWVAYGRAKTANALFALEVDKRYQGKGIRAFSVHPGGIKTNIARSARFSAQMKDFLGVDEAAGKSSFERLFITTADKAAAVILSGVKANRRRVLIGPDARAIDLMVRLMPERYQQVVSFASRQQKRLAR